MGKALQQLWLGLGTMFKAFEVLMLAVLHLCTWAEATAATFEDEAKDDRIAKAQARRIAMGITSGTEVQAIEATAT